MKFEIKHYTHYRYDQPVLFEPHSLRFRPREDPFQRILDFDISINPRPASVSEYIDLDGNTVYQAWFNGASRELTINTTALVETNNKNPFDYLVYPKEALRLPLEYPKELELLLKPYKMLIANSPELLAFVEELATKVNRQTVPFLTHLAGEISLQFQKEYRDQGGPNLPEKTFAEKKGACRDLAVLFMTACRMLGLAARFVSGYYFDVLDYQRHYLHSWVEVYVPGGGWRGFDPSSGLAVADRHISVSSSAIPRLCAPVTGIFLGNGNSTLNTDIKISPL